jgi:glycolate oxidase subunit GlcD
VLTALVEQELSEVVGKAGLITEVPETYLVDETETRSLVGRADAVVKPQTTAEVAALIRLSYAHDLPITVRGGGTGYAGGCVPNGGVVLSLERMSRVLDFDPLLWRMRVEAGVTTAEVRRRARENGLYYPPDPGAGEQSQIGGNIATNAGGPHAFKYGTTKEWVTGLEVVVPPGEIIRFGGSMRKDVAGYDFKSLLIGSEGTLGIITAAWLRLIPAVESAYPIVAIFDDLASGCQGIQAVLGSGLLVAVLDYVDEGALACAPPTFAPGSAFALLLEVDGTEHEARELRSEMLDVLDELASFVHAPTSVAEIAEVWRWRESMTVAVTTALGGKVSEDICVPIDRMAEAIAGTVQIGTSNGLRACSWGHAGDGNLHSTFLLAPTEAQSLTSAESAAEELFELAVTLGGTISGEHGVGLVKGGQLARMWAPRALELRDQVKKQFDPKNLLNPGKKL